MSRGLMKTQFPHGFGGDQLLDQRGNFADYEIPICLHRRDR